MTDDLIWDENEWHNLEKARQSLGQSDDIHCVNCDQLIRPTEDRDGIERHDGRYEYEYVHDDGNPICPITCIATPPGSTT